MIIELPIRHAFQSSFPVYTKEKEGKFFFDQNMNYHSEVVKNLYLNNIVTIQALNKINFKNSIHIHVLFGGSTYAAMSMCPILAALKSN